MTSLTGAKVAEIKVKHHARKFGVSKYGLSRIYKVILDLLAIKTIISFSHKPLLWFSMLAIPALMISIVALIHSLFSVLFNSAQSDLIVTAGVGVIFGTLAIFLMLCGALGELIYKTGDTDLDHLCSLTQEKISPENAKINH
jgi:hypothetical protein